MMNVIELLKEAREEFRHHSPQMDAWLRDADAILNQNAPCCPQRVTRTKYVRRAYLDGLRYAVQLIREYEPEHNKQYRERLAQHIEEKAK